MTRRITRGTAEYVGTFVHDSPEWHAARAAGLGSSEIAAVVGLSPYESRFSLWHRKAGVVGPQPADNEMELGTLLEEPIAQLFARRNPGVRVRRTGTWRHRDRPWQLANPDRIADGRLLEIKWAPHSDGWGADGTDEIPVYYRCQVLWQLDVFGLPEAILAALVANEYRQYLIRHEADEAAFLREAGQAFLDTVQCGQRPDIDAHSETYQIIRHLHPDIDGDDIEVDVTVAAPFLAAVENHRTAEAEKRRASAVLLDAMGNARRAFWAGQKIADRRPNGHGSVSLYPAKPKTTPGQKVSTAA